MDTPGGIQTLAVVNESGLYSMLFALKPTKARGVSEEHIAERQTKIHNFKRWVTKKWRKAPCFSYGDISHTFVGDTPLSVIKQYIED